MKCMKPSMHISFQQVKDKKMKKAIIIGCPGSGKTTFAEKLQRITGLPLYYLDAIWHKPDRTHIPRDKFDARLGEILSLDEWIIDGNYSRTLEVRIEACDTVFFFDLPTEICLAGAIERLGKGRYKMPWIDIDLDPKLEIDIKNFKTDKTPQIYNLMDKYRQNKNIIIFNSREESEEYLKEFEQNETD